ncbi:MAG: nodulation protein NfeD [Candidatus Firestonebacteria bacterium]
MRKIKLFVAALFSLLALSLSAKEVVMLKLSGAVNPASAAYLIRGINEAEKLKAECVIIEIDTPGGLDYSMREIVQKILDSKVPVITYVSPKGARWASAGLFIALASDCVVMASGTNLGAAHPVYLDGKMASEKVTNDAAAYIRSLAEKRKKDILWAEEAVRKSVSITETEALKKGVADLVSDSREDLLQKLDGRKIKLLSGGEIKLDLKAVKIVQLNQSRREGFLNLLFDPTIAYVLFLVGIYGLIYELASPGAVLPGVAGMISIILALISFNSLTVSLAGMALLVLAIVLFILEIKSSAHGGLAAGGVISLALGSVMLFSPMMPYYRISLMVVATMVVLSTAFFAIIIYIGVQSLKGRVVIGIQSLLGAEGIVKTPLNPVGIVYVNKEDWSAESGNKKSIKKGQTVRVLAVEGIKLIVEELKEKKK